MKGGPKNYAAGGAYQPKGTVTKAEHDALVARKRRPFTQDPIGTYPERMLEISDGEAA